MTRDEIIAAPYGTEIDTALQLHKLAVTHDETRVFVVHRSDWRCDSFRDKIKTHSLQDN